VRPGYHPAENTTKEGRVVAATATTEALDAYRTAWEAKDFDALTACYADDAVLINYSERNRPGSAAEVRGADAIGARFRGEPPDLKHELTDELADESGFAFNMKCTYPSGELVMWTSICTVRDGKVVRQVGVETWDE
jgi:ketosteroid isomerase-like protein